MRGKKISVLCCAALCLTGAASAETWTLRVKAVNGRVTYSHDQALQPRKQTSFTGKARRRGMGPEREMIFNAYLNAPEDGALRLDYQMEVAGEHRARPPFQAQGKALLRPGKPLLAVQAGGWKLVFELLGKAEGKGAGNAGTLAAALKCGRTSYPVKVAYLPNEQYSVVLYEEEGESVRKLIVGLLPNISALDDDFTLQYAFMLREGGDTLAEKQGDLVLSPGGGRRSVTAGKDCSFSAKAGH